MARIYVASSWRNAYYPEVVRRLREYGHEVYDFRNPPQGGIDRNTGKFYKSRWNMPDSADSYYCSNFSRAIAEKSDYYEKQGLNDIMDSLYSSVKQLMTRMTPAPKKYSEIHSSINTLFHTTEAMYNCASSPEGNLRSYTEQINSLSADYKKQESQVDIEIGELKKEDFRDFELGVLLKFL